MEDKFEETNTAKDREIAELKSRLAAQTRDRDHPVLIVQQQKCSQLLDRQGEEKHLQLRCFLERTQQSIKMTGYLVYIVQQTETSGQRKNS